MNRNQYPLEQVTLIKQKRLDEAEKILLEKKQLLAEEERKLLRTEEERDKVKHHKEDKLTQLRHELDTGSSAPKIQQMRMYLREVEEQLKGKELKVAEQRKKVTAAENAVETARKEMLKKRQSVEKMQMHKEEWKKQKKKADMMVAAAEEDEIGNVIHTRKKPL